VGVSDLYDATGHIEGQYEPGSRGRVLRNLLSVKNKRAMYALESQALFTALETAIAKYDRDHRFTADDLCSMHRSWLGGIYAWAGKYRQVNLEKGGLPFAAAHLVPRLMTDFEKQVLAVYTPCRFSSHQEIAHALAVAHVELLLIHPFREGNGRLARMLASLMSFQAGLPPLDFGELKGERKKEYFAAVRAGFDRDYDPMTKIFCGLIERTLRRHA